MSKVITIKLTNGEELLASLVSATEHILTIDRPRTFQIGTSVNAQGKEVASAGLVPWCVSAPDQRDIKLSRTHVAAFFEAGKEVSDGYLQATSGLILG